MTPLLGHKPARRPIAGVTANPPLMRPVKGRPTLAPMLGLSYARELRRGLSVLAVAASLVVPVAILVPLNGAVVASGRLVSASNVKKVQHPAGGVLSAILVQDGAEVRRGDVLARLEPKQIAGNLAALAAQLVEARLQEARLLAERDHRAEPDWPTLQVAGAAPASIAAAEATQGALFAARGQSQQSELALLGKQLEEEGQEVIALRAELASKSGQAKLVETERAGLESLFTQRLVTLSRVLTERRESLSLAGDIKRLKAQLAEAAGKIGGIRLQMARLDQTTAHNLLKDLAEVQEKQLVLTQQHAAALDVLKHLDIRAPQSGTVHDLAVHTVGGVIGAGEILMLIAPAEDGLAIETRLPAKDIDQVAIGQTARVVMPALDRATTPEFSGAVTYVSPDAARDPQSGGAYYTVRVALDRHAPNGQALHLVAGMPVEVFLATQSRSVASYLFKPLTDQFLRMFKDR